LDKDFLCVKDEILFLLVFIAKIISILLLTSSFHR